MLPTFGPSRLPRRVAVVGHGAAAQAMVRALGSVQGIGDVRHINPPEPADLAQRLFGVDAVVEMVGGVTPAFQLAMYAISNGIACFTTNPLLVAAHGTVLAGAAQGQGTTFGWQGAVFPMPTKALVTAQPVSHIAMAFATTPNKLLVRMGFRNEPMAAAKRHLKDHGEDFSDASGKHTMGRLIGMASYAFAQPLAMSGITRASIDDVDLADLKALRAWGLTLVFGATVQGGSGAPRAYVGPLAVGAGNPLAGALAGNRVLSFAHTAGYTTVLTMPDTPETLQSGTIAGVTADVQQWLLRPSMSAKASLMAAQGWAQSAESVSLYVRAPLSACTEIANQATILHEKTEGDTWCAMLESETPFLALPVASIQIPVSGPWEPAAANGLRLVA